VEPLAPEIKKLFEGRRLLVATRHGKEKILGPALEDFLGVRAFILPDFDSDRFGTFSGEVERPDDARTTLQKKVDYGMALSGATLAIGSEGSFGPHPQIGWVAANQEWLLLKDSVHDLAIEVQTVSAETNFAGREVASWAELEAFASEAGFPGHALILKIAGPQGFVLLEKGIQDAGRLRTVFANFQKTSPVVTAETDMRAMCNPSRQAVIRQALDLLLEKIASACPVCHTPGFGITDVRAGRPCAWCGHETQLWAAKVFSCVRCGHLHEEPASEKADPQYCPSCNP
jgi:hypothetical protein